MSRDSVRPNEYNGRRFFDNANGGQPLDNKVVPPPPSPPLDLPPPPPPPEMPPMPPARTFKGDSWRPEGGKYNSQGRSQQNEFSFRMNDQAPTYPSPQERDRSVNNSRPAQRNAQSYRGRGRGRGRAARIVTAERPLLQLHRGETSQKVLGLAGDNKAAQKFLSTDDFTDSDDEPMDESDLENDITHHPALNDNEESTDVVEPPTKRRAVAKESTEAANAPKWSNPDPYTVLPPVDEEPRKKKDVVKLIRKARIAIEKEEAAQNEVAANDDFISFGNEDQDSSEDEDYKSSGVPRAPTGPRQGNQPRRGQGFPTNGAPGTNIASSSARELGPPPGLSANASNSTSSHPVHKLPLKPAIGVEQQDTQGAQDGQDVNLGSRKRTRDDEIKTIPRWSSLRKGKGVSSDGSLAPEWVPRSDQNPTPWLVESQYRSESGGFRYVRL